MPITLYKKQVLLTLRIILYYSFFTHALSSVFFLLYRSSFFDQLLPRFFERLISNLFYVINRKCVFVLNRTSKANNEPIFTQLFQMTVIFDHLSTILLSISWQLTCLLLPRSSSGQQYTLCMKFILSPSCTLKQPHENNTLYTIFFIISIFVFSFLQIFFI